MRKVLCCLSLIFLFACSKSDRISNKYFIDVKINGVKYNLSKSCSLQYKKREDQNDWLIKISGSDSTVSTDSIYSLSVVFFGTNTGVTGSYTNREKQFITFLFEYKKGTDPQYGYIFLNNGSQLFSVNITSFDSTSARGTFSGQLNDGKDSITIANGKFYLPTSLFTSPI